MSTSFRYSYSFSDKVNARYQSVEANVTQVTFYNGRCGHNKHTIKFKAPVRVCEAVNAAEKWLSKPLTDAAFEKLLKTKDILYNCEERENCQYRYNALGGAIYLECIDFIGDGHIELSCGS